MEKQIQFISTSPTALVNLIDEAVKRQLDELKKNFRTKEPTNYISRIDLSKKFKVDLSTIHNWRKKGLIIGYQIGGKIYFKLDEVEKAIVKLKK